MALVGADEAAEANGLDMEALRAGDARAAAGHFQHACEIASDAGELWLNLATAQRQLKNDEGERTALEQALNLDQRNLMALIRLAQLHERLGEDGPATTRWSNVLSLAVAIDQPSLEFLALLDHARRYVEKQRHQLADDVHLPLGGQARESQLRADERRPVTHRPGPARR